ncbi:MAG: hypothetical protein ACOY3P_09915 [Planctomycetota bacterium]
MYVAVLPLAAGHPWVVCFEDGTPKVGDDALNLYRATHRAGHVYRLSKDCTTARLAVASERVESLLWRAPHRVKFTERQTAVLRQAAG